MLSVVGAEWTKTISEQYASKQRSFTQPSDDSGLSSNASSSAYSILPRASVPESTFPPEPERTSSSTMGLCSTHLRAASSIASLSTASDGSISGAQFTESEAAVPIAVVDAAVTPTPETVGQPNDETSAAYSASLKRASTFMEFCA